MMEIFMLSSIVTAILLVAFMDNWSTKTLITYRYLQRTDKKFREKSEEYQKDRSIIDDELNPFARRFMKYFGLLKGMTIFSILIRTPIFVLLFYLSLIDEPMFYSVYPIVMFYFGMIFSQILHAYIFEKRANKFGYNLKEKAKEI